MTNASVKPSLLRIEAKLDKLSEKIGNSSDQEEPSQIKMDVCDNCKEEMAETE